MKMFPLKLVSALFLAGVSAQSFAVTVQSLTIPLSVGYESNPQLSVSNEQSISRVTLTPSYSLTSNEGPNQWNTTASFSAVRTSNQAISQNRNDPSLNVGWTHSYETGQFSVTGLANQQSTRVSELTDSGIVSGDNTRKTYSASVNWLNNLSDRTSLSLGGSRDEAKYSGAVTTGLVDYQNESFNTKLNYSVNEQLQTFVQLSASSYKPQNSNSLSSKTKSADLGFTWNASDKLNINVSIGSYETQIEDNTKSDGWQGSVDAQYSTLRTNSHFSISRSQSPSSLGSINESNQLAAGWSYNVNERDNIALNISRVENLTLNKPKTTQFSANYTRELSLSWDFQLLAEHKATEDKLTNASSSSIMASIVYKLPDF